jgi:hypothetical protein
VNFEYRNSAGLADVDFHGQSIGHGRASVYPDWGAMAIGLAARHYTLEGKLHKGNHFRRLRATIAEGEESDASEKRIQKIRISNCDGRPPCV